MLFAKRLIYRARAILDVLRVQDRACTIRKTIKKHCARAVLDVLRVQERAYTIQPMICAQ